MLTVNFRQRVSSLTKHYEPDMLVLISEKLTVKKIQIITSPISNSDSDIIK